MKSRRVEATRSTCAHRGDTGVHQAEPTGGNEEAQRPHEQLGSWARCSSRPCRTRRQREIAIEQRDIAEGRRVAVLAEAATSERLRGNLNFGLRLAVHASSQTSQRSISLDDSAITCFGKGNLL